MEHLLHHHSYFLKFSVKHMLQYCTRHKSSMRLYSNTAKQTVVLTDYGIKWGGVNAGIKISQQAVHIPSDMWHIEVMSYFLCTLHIGQDVRVCVCVCVCVCV